METDLVYYRRRSAEETAAASRARDPRVRAVHLEFARRYRELTSAEDARQLEQHLVPAA